MSPVRATRRANRALVDHPERGPIATMLNAALQQ
jgi:hypothetical protein